MGVPTIILLTLITAALGALLFRRHAKAHTVPAGRIPPARKTAQSRKQAAQRSKPSQPGSPFRAVSIACAAEHCAAAKALDGKFYLVEVDDVPSLPLPACDLSKCGCRYSHHVDRRQDEGDRRTISGMQTEMHQNNGNEERRDKKTRRKTD